MSNKVKKTDGKKDTQTVLGQGLTASVEYVLAAVIIVMCLAVSFYAKEGYNQIGNAKFAAYKVVMEVGFSIFLVLAAVLWVFRLYGERRLVRRHLGKALKQRREGSRLSVTDLCALAYLLFSTISAVFGGFRHDALWGSFGWNMGWMSQLSFVLVYLAVSRFGRYYQTVLTVFCGSSFVVFLIGVLHRMQIDPIGFYEGLQGYQTAQFLSTMGQATWYASYLAVALPVGIGVFLFSEKPRWRILGGIYTVMGFASLVTQNSDSAYFALVGFMLVFLCVCVERRETLNRFVEVCTIFFAVGKVMHFLMRLHPYPDLEYDFFTEIVLDGTVTWVFLGICLLLCAMLYRRRNRPYSAVQMRLVSRIVLAAVLAAVVLVTGLIVLQSRRVLPERLGEILEAVSYFNWNDGWGNGRGRIWSFALRLFAGESVLHKLFGVGPDCFSSYVAAFHGEEAYSLWGDKTLTNAHNEWFTMLVNTGVFGAAAYIGIFGTSVRRCLRAWQKDYMLTAVAASAVSYMAYNFFCYQQVCCTPFVFLLLGVGEYLLRKEGK